ncbi:hypothetical protein Tco_1165415 [Tanacetum coccineum]
MGTVSDVIAGGTEGAVQQGPVRARVLKDLSAEEKERYKADIRATNILLQGIPKDIYSLINHYTDAKDIWENVKMILEGSELTKDDRESQLYDEFEHFRQNKGETILRNTSSYSKLIMTMRNIKNHARMQHELHVMDRIMMERFIQPNNDPLALVSDASVQQASSNARNKAMVQDGKVVVQDVRGRYNATNQREDHFQRQTMQEIGNWCGWECRRHYFHGKMHYMQAQEMVQYWIKNSRSFLAGETADECDDFDSDVDEGPTTQKHVHDSLTSEDPIYDDAGHHTRLNTLKKAKALVPKPISTLTVYPPNTPVKLVPRILPTKSQEAPDFNSFFKIKNLEHQIQEKDNVIRHLKDLVANVNDRSCEPYNAKDVTALIKQNDCVRVDRKDEIESLKAQLRSKESCFTSDYVKPKVLAPGMYAIDVKPIPHPLKNNRSAHLNYISHLKESVETVREIVEEARVVKPLDNTLNYACQYTKLSQELLEYVIGTCPKSFNERDNKAPSTPLLEKQVIFRVNTSTEASGSKPRSNTKKNRILPAKTENKKKVEDHPRTNKSVWTKVNRVDSSISSKRVVINSNSESVCKTCNKCLNSASHEMCVVNILNSVNATPTVKIVLNKGKQIWKPKGKLFDNSLNKTRQIGNQKAKLSDLHLTRPSRFGKQRGKLFANVGYVNGSIHRKESRPLEN